MIAYARSNTAPIGSSLGKALHLTEHSTDQLQPGQEPCTWSNSAQIGSSLGRALHLVELSTDRFQPG